jgi:hypothetical protein
VVTVRWSALRGTQAQEYVLRFVFGGAATVLAGLVAQRYGPGVGGLFLAFPAIFPAGVTLIESHEKQRKAKIGSDGTHRGRMAASLDASGAALGCIGLAAFALVLWRLLPAESGWLTIPAATVAWAAVACGLWALRRMRLFGQHQRIAKHGPHARSVR